MGRPNKLKTKIKELEENIEGYQQQKESLETLIADEWSKIVLLKGIDASTKEPGSLKLKNKTVYKGDE